jgi:branched-chain amino acid transport system ATP-binding protein
MSRAVLEARDLSVRFGGVQALTGVDLEVREGQIVGLIGPNGAGKTTLIDAITGFVPCRGSVSVDGRDLTRMRPHARVRAGLGRTWQAVELFDDLSVAENVAVAAHSPSPWSTVRDLFRHTAQNSVRIAETLEAVGIGELVDAVPSELSEGQRKLVGISRAFASYPKVVCLDEPAAGLDTDETVVLGKQLRRIGDQGTPMLLIDHDMSLVFGTCDYVVVLEFGRVIAAGSPQEIGDHPRVVAAYLGNSTDPGRKG